MPERRAQTTIRFIAHPAGSASKLSDRHTYSKPIPSRQYIPVGYAAKNPRHLEAP